MAQATELHNIGLTVTAPEQLPGHLLAATDDVVSLSRPVKVMLETCTKCGACARACHSYLGTGDVGNIPAVRGDLLRNFYRKNFTVASRLASWLTGTATIWGGEVERWTEYAYQCNLCRRCTYYCPLGIDTAEITMAMRHILAKVGVVPRYIAGTAANILKAGNNTGIQKPAIINCCEFLEAELKEETGKDIIIPIDKPDSDILYVPSSTEFVYNVDTLLGVVKLFHVLGVNWTLSSTLTEAANYGLFYDFDLMKYHNKRMLTAVQEVGATMVVQGECGHGWRVAKMFSEGTNGAIPFKIVHILELAANNLPKLKLEKVTLRATLHDPCNYARAGGLAEAPRRILQACVTDFVEMMPNRELNYCCGGGAGLLMDEIMDVRMKLAKMKAEQLRALGELDVLVAPCASCKAQFPHVIKHYGLPVKQVMGIMEIMGAALRL